jgi:aminoglycoside/choline kinase family phosphotransferase
MMKSDEMFVIDFQDARMGPVSYDLASLVSDPYAELSPEIASEMVKYFIERKAHSTERLNDLDEFRRELELMTVQRMLKAIGTYSNQASIGKMVYIPYIAPALKAAVCSMEALGGFDEMLAVLVDASIEG